MLRSKKKSRKCPSCKYIRLYSPSRSTYIITGTAEGPKNLGHHINRFLSSFLYLQEYWGEERTDSYVPAKAGLDTSFR